MARLFIDLEISDIKLNLYSSYEKYDDCPVKRGQVIVIYGKPIYSTTYAFPEVLDFNSGGKRIELPEIFSIRVEQTNDSIGDIGTLNYVEEYSDNELGIDEPTQFEAIVPHQEKEFKDAWNLIGNLHLGKIGVSCSIEAPETDASGYTVIIDIEKEKSWPLRSFSLRRHDGKA